MSYENMCRNLITMRRLMAVVYMMLLLLVLVHVVPGVATLAALVLCYGASII